MKKFFKKNGNNQDNDKETFGEMKDVSAVPEDDENNVAKDPSDTESVNDGNAPDPNQNPNGGSPSNQNGDADGGEYTVDDAVDLAGYGKFQRLLTFLAGMGWFADAFEILILSILGELITCEWYIYQYENALITTVVFAGMAFGSPAFGAIADILGRKTALGISMFFLFVFGSCSSLSTSLVMMLILRAIMGFALGGVAQGVTLCCEYYPTQSRGTAGFYLSYFWGVGTILMIAIAWLVMRTLGNWRIFLFIASLPALLVFCLIKWYPESARFYLVSNQYDKAVAELEKMAKMNDAQLPPGKLRRIAEDQLEKRGSIADLLKKDHRRATLLFWYIWFAIAFTYYGVALTQPIAIKYGKVRGISDPGDTESGLTSILPCKKFSDWDFFNLLWTSAAEFPGLLIFTVLVHFFQRKTVLMWSSFVETLIILLLFLDTNVPMLVSIIFFFARGIICGAFQLLYIMTSESFPTTLRASSMGTCSALARVGGAAVPFATQAVVIQYPEATLSILAVVIFLAGVATGFLKKETKGCRMMELTRDGQEESEQGCMNAVKKSLGV